MALTQHKITKGTRSPCALVRVNRRKPDTVLCEGTRTYCQRVLDSIRSVGVKPRIYWTHYPRSKRGYWRVSPKPRLRSNTVLDLWTYAHNMAREMNNHEGAE